MPGHHPAAAEGREQGRSPGEVAGRRRVWRRVQGLLPHVGPAVHVDFREAQERGHVGEALCYNCVLRVLDEEDTTAILMAMIRQSSLPLRSVERQFAIDSSGFATSRYAKWVDEKYSVNRQKADWVKAHLCIGVKTQTVTPVFMDEKNRGDCPQFDPLTKATAENFRVEEMSADKAYLSNDNLELVVGMGATPSSRSSEQPAGRRGSLAADVPLLRLPAGRVPGALPPPQSMIESAFSMIKRKFGDSVRAKTDTAMRNEALCKILCHNIAF